MNISNIAKRFLPVRLFTKAEVNTLLQQQTIDLVEESNQRILGVAERVVRKLTDKDSFLKQPQELIGGLIGAFPSDIREKLRDQLQEIGPVSPFIKSLYTLGEAVLPPEAFSRIKYIAGELPELAEVAVEYLNDGNPELRKKLVRFDALKKMFFEPSSENLREFGFVGKSDSSLKLREVIKERLYEEVKSLKPLIREYASDKASDAMGVPAYKDSIVAQAAERAGVLLPALIDIFKQDVELQDKLVKGLQITFQDTGVSNSDSTEVGEFAKELVKLESLKERCSELEQFLGALKVIKAFPNNTANALNS
jgi:hypothetical protein